METWQLFANKVAAIASEFGTIKWQGSYAKKKADIYSDIDLILITDHLLNDDFYTNLSSSLTNKLGSALIRFDPDDIMVLNRQRLKISFYNYPVFQRTDLDIVSEKTTKIKYPSPFPLWSFGDAAVMNLVWAAKYINRKNPNEALPYIKSASQKIGLEDNISLNKKSFKLIIDKLKLRPDVDQAILNKLLAELTFIN